MRNDIDLTIPAVLTITTKSDGDGKKKRYFHTTASSTVEDAHEDEFTERAIDKMATAAKGSNMSIFLNHEYRIPEDLFGTTTDAVAINRSVLGEVVKDLDLTGFINEANPRARETADALEGGAKLGVSIGARIKEYSPRDENDPMGGWIIDDVELKEASIVGMPANPRTWVHYATKAVQGFERDKVSEAADMTKTATAVAELPVDESVTEDETETMKLLEQNDPTVAKILSTEQLPDANIVSAIVDGEDEGQPTFDGGEGEDNPEVEAADAAATPEEPAQEADTPAESPEVKAASETPAEVLSQAIDNSVETLSVDALRAGLATAKTEISKRDESIDQLTKERDAALATLATATAIVESIATTPMGRKAIVKDQVDDYRSRIGGVYDKEFVAFLKGSNPQ